MMQQYQSIRRGLPADTFLLFRLGDFYELFSPRSQVALGNALVPEALLPFRLAAAKLSLARKCVPKWSLGTRDKGVPKCNLGTRHRRDRREAGVANPFLFLFFFFLFPKGGRACMMPP